MQIHCYQGYKGTGKLNISQLARKPDVYVYAILIASAKHALGGGCVEYFVHQRRHIHEKDCAKVTKWE
jgi:hypothetical protein